MKKRKLCYWFTILALVISVNAYGAGQSDGSSDGKADLTFWVFQDWTVGTAGEYFNNLVDEFIALHPDEINSIEIIGKDSEALQTSLMAGVGLPDIFTAEFGNGKAIIDSVELINIKPYFDSEPSDFKGMFTPSFLNILQKGDQMYGFPYTGYAHLLFRNLTVLENAGIDPDEGISDWNEWLEQMEQVSSHGTYAISTWGGDWRASGAIVGANEQLVADLGIRNNKTTLQAEDFIPAFEFMLQAKPYSGPMVGTDDTAIEAFKTDKIAFLVNGPWIAENLNASGVSYDAIPAPAMDSSSGYTGGFKGGEMICGISGNHDDLVYEFMRYIVEYENELKFARDLGRIVLNDEVMSDSIVSQNMLARASKEAFSGGIDSGVFFEENQMWVSPIGSVTSSLWNGNLSPEEAADEMIRKINDLYSLNE